MEYTVDGDVVFYPTPSGEIIKFDLDDLELILGLGTKWKVSNVRTKKYARLNSKKASPKGYVLIHRVVVNAPEGMEVDHLNGDGLDNRKANLRIATRLENSRNRKPNTGNALGVRGVYFERKTKRYVAQAFEGKNKKRYRKRCRTLNIARITVSMLRAEVWGKHAA